jgi:protein-S-isoprenylcysteine O-methyltransferase Ste14
MHPSTLPLMADDPTRRNPERLKAANRRTGLVLLAVAVLFFFGIIASRMFDDPLIPTAVLGAAVILYLVIAIGRHLRK